MSIFKKTISLVVLCLLLNFSIPNICYANAGWIGPFSNLDASFGMDDNYNLYGAEYCIHNGKKVRYKDNIRILQSCMDHQNKKLWVVYNSPGNIAWINTEDLTINYLPTITPAHNFFKLMVRGSQIYYTRFYTNGYAKGAIAKIYKYNGSAWIELTGDMESGDTYVTTYWGTALNASGTLFIVGTQKAENNYYYPVKQYINNSWVFQKNASMDPTSANVITKDFIVGKDDYFWLDIDGGIGLTPGFYSESLIRLTNQSVYLPKDYYLTDDGSVFLATLPQGGGVQVVKTPPNSTTGYTLLYQSENTIPLDTPIKIVGTSSAVTCCALTIGTDTYLYGNIPTEIATMHISILAGEAKKAAEAAQTAADAAATAASGAKTSADTAANLLNAPLISQFTVNGGALENLKAGVTDVTTGIRAQNSPNNTGYNQIQYRIVRVNSDGTESSLVAWTSFTSNSAKPSITSIAGINNIVLYVKNTTSGAISKASTTLIAGTDAERETALGKYYGGMYAKAKSAETAAGSAKTAADNAYNAVKAGSALANNASYAASRTVYKAANGTEYSAARWAYEAYILANQANSAATIAQNAVKDDSTSNIYANTSSAASKATTAVSEIQSNTYGLSKIKGDTGSAVTQLTNKTSDTIRKDVIAAGTSASTAASRTYDSTENKSVTQIAKEARDKVTQLSQIITPVIHSVKGQNGATCTTNDTFKVVISASNATQYRARVLNTSAWYTSSGSGADAWGTGNTISVGGIAAGAKTIEVQARSSEGGAVATDSITIFRL